MLFVSHYEVLKLFQAFYNHINRCMPEEVTERTF